MSKQTAGRSYFIKNTVRLKKFKDPSLINVCVQFTFLYFMTHGEELQPPFLGFFDNFFSNRSFNKVQRSSHLAAYLFPIYSKLSFCLWLFWKLLFIRPLLSRGEFFF